MAYNPHQPCDSYFVESQDAYTPSSSQDYVKMIGRRRQEAMVDTLSRQAYEAYIEDIVVHMKQMEVNIPFYLTSSPLTDFYRTRRFPTLLRSTSKRRSSGSCVPT